MFKPLRLPFLLHPYPLDCFEYLPQFSGENQVSAETHLEYLRTLLTDFRLLMKMWSWDFSPSIWSEMLLHGLRFWELILLALGLSCQMPFWNIGVRTNLLICILLISMLWRERKMELCLSPIEDSTTLIMICLWRSSPQRQLPLYIMWWDYIQN